MIPNVSITRGELKVHQLIDTTGVYWNPFKIPKNMPVRNPFTDKLFGEWEDGYHMMGHGNPFMLDTDPDEVPRTLFLVENNKVIRKYELKLIQ